MKRTIILASFSVAAIVLPAVVAGAQSIRVTQVDTSELLVRGTVDAYVSLPDGVDTNPEALLSLDAWSAWETADAAAPANARASAGRPLEIVEVTPGAAADTGIDFLLLVDNSGSMYERAPDGRTRMEHAQTAIAEFLRSIDESEDRVAMAAFNTYLYPLARLGASTGELARSLQRIEEPETESAFTELYQAMSRRLDEFAGSPGRKAVIVLSDGEDFPFSVHSQLPHPIWGDERLNPDDVIRRFQEEEVTLYGISFADTPDRSLTRIASETGGSVFQAYNAWELSRVYAEIRESIRGEVRVRVRVPSAPTVTRNLTVSYGGSSDDAEYFAPMLLGAPGESGWVLPLLLALLAIAGIILLHLVSFERAATRPEIQPIGRGRSVTIQNDVTVIGSAPDAAVSLAGNRGIDHAHATVVHDEEKKSYTLVSERPVRVNNRLVKNRRLKPGDVIAIEEVTLVFDAPEEVTSPS